MRTPLIAGNWKMNTTVREAVELAKAMREPLDKTANVEKVVCTPFVSLAAVKDVLAGSSIDLGAQNLFYEEKGAYTGEISPLMLAGLCQWVILGHSERRQYFHETGSMINKKVSAALKTGLKPILCIGEKLVENEAGRTRQVLSRQLAAALHNITDVDGLVIAYEPIWAIGTGRAATGGSANETIAYIRQRVSELWGAKTADGMRILYGGSVTAANIAEFVRQPEIDGALVGGASLKAAEFVSIVSQTARIWSRS